MAEPSSFDTLLGPHPTAKAVEQLLAHLTDRPETERTPLAEAAFEWAAVHDDYDVALLALRSGCRMVHDRLKACIAAGHVQAARAVATRENGWVDGLRNAILGEHWAMASLFLDEVDRERLRTPGIMGLFSDKPQAPLTLGLRLTDRLVQQAPEAPFSSDSLWLHELETVLGNGKNPHAITWLQHLLDKLPEPLSPDVASEALMNHLIYQRPRVAALLVPATPPESLRERMLTEDHFQVLDLAVSAQPLALRKTWVTNDYLQDLLPCSVALTQQEEASLARQAHTAPVTTSPTRRRRRA